jgi:hypothetical protein
MSDSATGFQPVIGSPQATPTHKRDFIGRPGAAIIERSRIGRTGWPGGMLEEVKFFLCLWVRLCLYFAKLAHARRSHPGPGLDAPAKE